MKKGALWTALSFLAVSAPALAVQGNLHWHTIHIQIPVRLKHAKVVFNMDHPVFIPHTKEPVGLSQLRMMVAKFTRDHTRWKIDAVFQGADGYMLLNDKAYNQFMHVRTGNPYRGQIEALFHKGVDIEECGVTMRAHHWGNKQLLPNVKVNGGAVARIIWLEQHGYIEVNP